MLVPKGIGPLSNSKCGYSVDLGNRDVGVKFISKRGTTQTKVKAPKCWFSVKG